MEMKLPGYWCTIVRHLILHTFTPEGTIRRIGPFPNSSMLPGERYHPHFKRSTRSKKNPAKSATTTIDMGNMEYTDTKSETNYDAAYRKVWTSRIVPKDLDLPQYLARAMSTAPKGIRYRGGDTKLSAAMFEHLLELYASGDEDFHRMRDFYATDRRQLRRRVPDLLEWDPRTRRPNREFTPSELKSLEVKNEVKFYKKCTLNEVVFSSSQHLRTSAKTDRSGVKTSYVGAHGGRNDAYGVIQRIFTHRWPLDPSGVERVALHVEWYPIIDEHGDPGLVRIKRDPNHEFNRMHPIWWLKDCWPQNVAFWPADPFDVGDEFFVIDRLNQY